MKQHKRLRMVASNYLFIALIGLFSNQLKATTKEAGECPESFVAKVKSVTDVKGAVFPKVEVDFEIIKILRGETIQNKKIQVVKDGPVEFVVGKTYTVESRESWLCSALPNS